MTSLTSQEFSGILRTRLNLTLWHNSAMGRRLDDREKRKGLGRKKTMALRSKLQKSHSYYQYEPLKIYCIRSHPDNMLFEIHLTPHTLSREKKTNFHSGHQETSPDIITAIIQRPYNIRIQYCNEIVFFAFTLTDAL